MLDLGFSKIAVIGAVALIVLGPERLPKVARIAGTLFGRAQRYLRDVKDEVAKDMALAELVDAGKAVSQEFDHVEQGMRQAWHDIKADAEPAASTISVGQSNYTSSLSHVKSRRVGSQHWRARMGRTPQWYKQQTGVKARIRTEASRMAYHRRYSAHLVKKKVSFFD